MAYDIPAQIAQMEMQNKEARKCIESIKGLLEDFYSFQNEDEHDMHEKVEDAYATINVIKKRVKGL